MRIKMTKETQQLTPQPTVHTPVNTAAATAVSGVHQGSVASQPHQTPPPPAGQATQSLTGQAPSVQRSPGHGWPVTHPHLASTLAQPPSVHSFTPSSHPPHPEAPLSAHRAGGGWNVEGSANGRQLVSVAGTSPQGSGSQPVEFSRAINIKIKKHRAPPKMVAAACARTRLTSLPTEVVLYIFSYLTPDDLIYGVRPTCRCFYYLSYQSCLWGHVTLMGCQRPPRVVDFFIHNEDLNQKFFKKVLTQKLCVMSFGSESGRNQDRRCVWRKEKTLPLRKVVKSIEERGSVWSKYSVTEGWFNPKLQRLTLERKLFFWSVDFLDRYKELVHLQLRVKVLSQRKAGTVTSLFNILQRLNNLRTLKMNISTMPTLKPSQICSVRKSMMDYFSLGPRLRQIELTHFVNNEILATILDKCSEVEVLSLYRARLSPKVFTALSKKPKSQLTSLRIKRCPKLNDTCLEAMSVAFPYLTSLELTLTGKMTDKGVGHLLRTCGHLTFLKLMSPNYETASVDSGERRKLTGDCLKELAHHGNLQTLVLENFSFLSDPVFKELCRHQRRLHTVELTECLVSNGGIETLAESCPLLQTVTINHCHNISSLAVAYLVSTLPRLHTLTCRFCDFNLLDLEQLFPRIRRSQSGKVVYCELKGGPRSLRLQYCQGLTALGVSTLALLCPNLLHLDIQAANFVNDHTFRQILRGCPHLQHLKLETLSHQEKVNTLTDSCVQELQCWGRGLRSLHLLTYTAFSTFALEALLYPLVEDCKVVLDCTPYSYGSPSGESRGLCKMKEVLKCVQQMEKDRLEIHFSRWLRHELLSDERLEPPTPSWWWGVHIRTGPGARTRPPASQETE